MKRIILTILAITMLSGCAEPLTPEELKACAQDQMVMNILAFENCNDIGLGIEVSIYLECGIRKVYCSNNS